MRINLTHLQNKHLLWTYMHTITFWHIYTIGNLQPEDI